MADVPPYDWGRLQRVKVMARSVSQVKEYLESLGGCRYRYFLNRVVRAWDRPAAWLPQGTAEHAAAEWWERGGRNASLAAVQRVFTVHYRTEVDRMLTETPNPHVWFASGPYSGQEDIDRRYTLGLESVERYYNYYVNQKPGEVVWITPTGDPAIELPFEFELEGVRIKGFIDQIVKVRPPKPKSKAKAAVAEWESAEDLLRLRDIKSGQKPGGTFQLRVYDLAMEFEYGVTIGQGDYFLTREGRPTRPYDLTVMSADQVSDLFKEMDEGVKAEDFTPSPDPDKCDRCGVRTACRFAAM